MSASEPSPSSSPSPSDAAARPARHLQQQHKLAKDLIRAARAGDAAAIARLRAAFPDRAAFKLADAQLVVAREAGFDSWPKLVRHVEARELEAFDDALRRGDADALRRLLAGSEHLRAQVNAPRFDFGRRALHVAAGKGLDAAGVLLDFGADPNLGSEWAAGPFLPLDEASEPAARHLVHRGATLTPHAAARLGWAEELRALLDADPALVHARGGDGKQPLHDARTPAIADLLLDRGAEVDARCVDHHATPAQYALVDRPDVCRHLLARGASADVFMAARLDEPELLSRLLDEDPAIADARINFPGYAPVPPGHIYCWSLGWYRSPFAVANAVGGDCAVLLAQRTSPKTLFIDGLLFGAGVDVDAIAAANPDLSASLSADDHRLLAHAAHLRMDEGFKRMLAAGFDPAAPGLDGGTALHQACWTGAAELVDLLLASRAWDLEIRDPTHGSTPLGWALHGSAHCRHARGDYPAVVRRLLAAGARTDVPANKLGTTMEQQCGGDEAVLRVLREAGG